MNPLRTFTRVAVMTIATLLAAGILAADGGHDHGVRSHPITTSSAEAQRLFDVGLSQAWGFNHIEAARSFRAATAADPDCAMCWWGVALVLGPNINAALDPAHYPEILNALDRAHATSKSATKAERAYIKALGERYSEKPVEDRTDLDRAYARAMRRVANSYPKDLDAATLFAESLMDTMPWDYWTETAEPRPLTREFIDVLEKVLTQEPSHSGANHLLIHAVEKTRPDLGVPAAERIEAQEQATGHLIHMASHIYIRVGRYDDAARVNAMAIEDDDEYARHHEVPLEYVPYMLHNHHMRWAALTFAGRAEESFAEASYLADHAPPEALRHPVFGSFIQHLLTLPLFDDLRYGRWQSVLEFPAPADDLLYPQALRHFGRGIAHVRQGNLEDAQVELDALRTVAVDPRVAEAAVNFNSVTSLLTIAERTLTGEVAGARGDWGVAVESLEVAVDTEDALVYDEPPPWLPPARQWLGDLLVRAGRTEDAAGVFRADLEIYPDNAWSVAGLQRVSE